MSQGFYTAISGITSSQQKIDVVSDNIANINTVAFKESQINFSDVFARTISMGASPSRTIGGSNPIQIGLGTKVASISKNFASGTPQSTGVISDLYLDGPGYFCVEGANHETLLTRAGNFSVDTEGYLTTATGNRILGTDVSYSIDGSSIPAKIPPMLTLSTQGNTNNTNLLTSPLGELNALKLKKSTSAATPDFNIEVTRADGSVTKVPINISAAKNLQEIFNTCNTTLNSALGTAGAVKITAPTIGNGTIQMIANKASLGVPYITSVKITSLAGDFGASTELGQVAGKDSDPTLPATGTITYTSKILDYQASVGPADNIDEASKLTSYYIDGNGSIQAAYANGDRLTAVTDPETKRVKLNYITLNGNVNIDSDAISIKADIIEPANLQLQLGSVVNDKGLIAVGNNNFKAGPNAGDVMYSIASNNGFAKITSGSLESSNVDLTKQFAELIVAQRSIEANSRTFSTISSVLQNLIQMGR